MAAFQETVICPHCGAENAKSPIVTMCAKCLLPLGEGTTPASASQPLPSQPTPEYPPAAVPPLPRSDGASRTMLGLVISAMLLGVFAWRLFGFVRDLGTTTAARAPASRASATPPPTAQFAERPEPMLVPPQTPRPAVPAQVSYPPLQAAAVAGNAAEVKRLLESGTPVDQKDTGGHTALQRACENGTADPEVLRLLLAYGADVEARCADSGLTPLHWTASKDHTAGLTVLLKYKPDVNARDAKGHSPLHEAADAGNAEVAKTLLDHGADVAATDNDGQTPLHAAVY